MSSQAMPQLIDDAPAPLSEVSRIFGVFASPKSAFTDIVARPRWIVPVILSVVVALCFVTLLSKRVGFDRISQQQLDQNPRTQSMSADDRAKALAMSEKISLPIAYVSAVAGAPLTIVIVGAVLLFMANSMLGGQLRFSQTCAITAYAFLTSIVSAILTIVVMFIRSPDEFDLKNPLAFNLGAFLGDTTPKWLMALATSLDVFSFWTMALIAIGLTVAIRKLPFSKAFMTILIPWAVVVLLKVGAAAIF